MLKDALLKIETELTANTKDSYIQAVGSFLNNYVRNNPDDAVLIVAEGKTIKGSLSAMRAEAEKNKSNGVGVLTDQEGFAIVLKYFGVKVPEAEPVPAPVSKGFGVTLDDLL